MLIPSSTVVPSLKSVLLYKEAWVTCSYSETLNFVSCFLLVPATGLFFTLNGSVYLPGDIALITDIETFTGPEPEDAAMSLACVTSNVNAQCCRVTNGGQFQGDWYFPNGNVVPRNGNNENANFTTSVSTHQVRLSRRNDAQIPTGNFTCRIPDQVDHMLVHEASISLIIGRFFNCSKEIKAIYGCMVFSV